MSKLRVESTLTDRYQTTIPTAIRQGLGLKRRDKIRFVLEGNGTAVLSRASPYENDDAEVAQFLNFLARELKAHPESFQEVNPSLIKQARALIRKAAG